MHTGESPAEIAATEWARKNSVPQIVYAPHPEGETTAQRSARIHTLLDHAGRDTIIDLSSPGETSDVVTIARNHHFIVSNAYHYVIEAPPISEHPALANTGTPILITGPGVAPNRQALYGLLDRIKRSFSDIVLVHTADTGAETIAQQWAKDRLVPQMVFPPDRFEETVEQRHARHAAILDNIDLVRIYDVSEPGNPSELAELARQRNLVVSDSRSAVEHAPAESLERAQSHLIDVGSDDEIASDTGIFRSF